MWNTCTCHSRYAGGGALRPPPRRIPTTVLAAAAPFDNEEAKLTREQWEDVVAWVMTLLMVTVIAGGLLWAGARILLGWLK